MNGARIDLTDLLAFDMDDLTAAPEPGWSLEVVDDECCDEFHDSGTLLSKATSDGVLGKDTAAQEPIDIEMEELCLTYDPSDPDGCPSADDEEWASPGESPAPVVPSRKVNAFNTGMSNKQGPPGTFDKLMERPRIHILAVHRIHLKAPPLDAVHLLLRSQIALRDRNSQPDCAAAVIKAHHDLRLWSPLLKRGSVTAEEANFMATLRDLRDHPPVLECPGLWQLWKQAQDQILGLLPYDCQLAV
jgi:hypothetical protein